MGPETYYVEHERYPGGPYIEPTRHYYWPVGGVTTVTGMTVARKTELHRAAKARRAKAKKGGKR